MQILLLVAHLAAVLLAALALWSMRHELSETAASRFEWLLPTAFAVATATVLLIVSPGKRLELWVIAIAIGFAVGLGAGMIPTAIKDFSLELVRIKRTWDGTIAAGLLLLLALVRFVTTELMGRQSGGYGVLAAAASFLAAYLAGRVITLLFYNAPRTIHLDMVRGQSYR
ncbi:hypothetical protein [Reyranella sp.]|jgi:hypothetical protein|uniref:hypothetical protein n=1 Tax=Reyranella sp. TaxID=1929291 RepID=UPI003D12FA38